MLKQGLDSFSYYMHWRHAGQSIDTLLDRRGVGAGGTTDQLRLDATLDSFRVRGVVGQQYVDGCASLYQLIDMNGRQIQT